MKYEGTPRKVIEKAEAILIVGVRHEGQRLIFEACWAGFDKPGIGLPAAFVGVSHLLADLVEAIPGAPPEMTEKDDEF